MPPGFRGQRSWGAPFVAVPTRLVSVALVVPEVPGKPDAEVPGVREHLIEGYWRKRWDQVEPDAAGSPETRQSRSGMEWK
jgi:hypothetical protein